MSRPVRITVLISGSGSNLQALMDACREGRINGQITHVISNMPEAYGLKRAAQADIDCTVLPHGNFELRESFDQALALLIAAQQPDLVVLAGFMRIIGPHALTGMQGRMINLHPSLLPRHRGTNTYARAIDAGDEQHGASIHFVTEELDGGPVLSQVVIPILESDSAESLAARLGPQEHRLIAATVEFLAKNRVEIHNGQIHVEGRVLKQPLQLNEDDSFDPIT